MQGDIAKHNCAACVTAPPLGKVLLGNRSAESSDGAAQPGSSQPQDLHQDSNPSWSHSTSAAAPGAPVCNCLQAHSFLGVLREQRQLQTTPKRRQRALNEEDRNQPLHCSLSRATCRTSCPPPPFDRDPHHALVCSLQLLELLLQHQAAAQNLAVLLVTLTDASAATAQLEGEGVFLFIDLRQLRRQILSQELKHFCDSKTVFHVTEGKNSIENVGAATVPLSKVLQQQLVARSPAQVALKHPHDVQDCSLLLSSLPELHLWKWLT